MSLLTIGGKQVIGQWAGAPGEFYVGWHPLIGVPDWARERLRTLKPVKSHPDASDDPK